MFRLCLFLLLLGIDAFAASNISTVLVVVAAPVVVLALVVVVIVVLAAAAAGGGVVGVVVVAGARRSPVSMFLQSALFRRRSATCSCGEVRDFTASSSCGQSSVSEWQAQSAPRNLCRCRSLQGCFNVEHSYG